MSANHSTADPEAGHSHGGGHQHGPNCNHDHGHGGGHGGGHGSGGAGKKPQKKGLKHILAEWGGLVRAVNYSGTGLILTIDVFFLIPLVKKDNEFEAQFHTVAICGLWLLIISCFYHASNTKNTPLKVQYAPQHNTFMKVKNEAMCDKCKAWKPQRTHHCSVCKTCTLKMDHHCPWLDNCVGAYNHKSFTLYCCYMAIGAIHYMYLTISAFWMLYSTKTWSEQSTWWYVFWVIMTFVCVPVCFATCNLAYYHIRMLLNNLTTLENMGGVQTKNACSYWPNPVNVFDLGMNGNMRLYFGENPLLWFLPTNVEYDNDCTWSQNNSIVTISEYENVKNKENPALLKKYTEEGKFDYTSILEKAEKLCDGKHMQLNGAMYEYQG